MHHKISNSRIEYEYFFTKFKHLISWDNSVACGMLPLNSFQQVNPLFASINITQSVIIGDVRLYIALHTCLFSMFRAFNLICL